ncbi:unnamed protein product, partial [Owenia fusiformis]
FPNIAANKQSQRDNHSPESLGVGVGIGLGIAAVLVAGFIVFLMYRRYSKAKEFNGDQMNAEPTSFENRVIQKDHAIEPPFPLEAMVGTGDIIGVSEKDKEAKFPENDSK